MTDTVYDCDYDAEKSDYGVLLSFRKMNPYDGACHDLDDCCGDDPCLLKENSDDLFCDLYYFVFDPGL